MDMSDLSEMYAQSLRVQHTSGKSQVSISLLLLLRLITLMPIFECIYWVHYMSILVMEQGLLFFMDSWTELERINPGIIQPFQHWRYHYQATAAGTALPCNYKR